MQNIKIYEIPTVDYVEKIDDPRVGMIFYIADIDMYYSVKALKEINSYNTKGDKVVEYIISDYAEFGSGSGGGSGLTAQQLANIAKIPVIQSTVDGLPNNYAAKAHRHDASEIDNLPSGGNGGSTTIVNDLTTGGTNKALSAEQGKVIKSSLDNMARKVENKAESNHTHTGYASVSHRHDASEIDNLPSGGGVSQEDINTAVNNYLTEHPVQSGATAQQAAQIEANKTAIGDENSGLIKGVNDLTVSLSNVDAVSLNGKSFSEPMTKAEYEAISAKDPNILYLVNDDQTISGIPDYSSSDANKVLAVNSNGTALAWINAPSGSGTGLTSEQLSQLQVAYEHSQSIHISSNDISNFVTREEMNSAISSADVIITTETGKKYKLIVNEDNGTLSTILLVNNGNIIVSKTDITINEGEQTEFNVYIDKSPSAEQIVSITSNNPNININPSSLSFNSSNYSEPQSVTISITKDDNYENENSVITLSSDSVEDKTINVEIIDIDIEPVTYTIEGIPTGNIFAESEVYFTVKDSKNNIIDPSQYSYTVDAASSYKVNEGNVTGVYMWKENSSNNVTVTLPDNSTQTFTLNTGSKPTEISNPEISEILTLNTLLNSDEIELYPIYGRGDRIVYKNGLTYVRRYVKELQNVTINLTDDSANESVYKVGLSIDELNSLNVKAITSQGASNNRYNGKENIWIHIVGTIPTAYIAQISSSGPFSYDCNESNKIYIMTYNKATFFINRYRLSLDQMQNSIGGLGKSTLRYITNDYEDIPVSVR